MGDLIWIDDLGLQHERGPRCGKGGGAATYPLLAGIKPGPLRKVQCILPVEPTTGLRCHAGIKWQQLSELEPNAEAC